MGNDGGSIPKRRELVKEAAKEPNSSQLKETQLERQEFHWTTDPLTNTLLREPIVSDCNGMLYSKESILEFLIPTDDENSTRKKAEQAKLLAGFVTGLRDVVEVKFDHDGNGQWICPITSKLLGANVKAVYLAGCGHVFTEVAIVELKHDKTCPTCGRDYEEEHIIPILPVSESDIERLSRRVQALKARGLTHALKKAPGCKKKRKNGEMDGNVETVSTDTSITEKMKNDMIASSTTKPVHEQHLHDKKRKLRRNDNLNSLFSAKDKPLSHNKNDFMSRGFTIPTDKR